MTRNLDHSYYPQTKKDQYSYNVDLTIKPVFCGESIGSLTFNSGDSDCIETGEKIKVYYKMGNSFMFIVPNSLRVESILFDAIDSTIDPKDSCLLENEVCCEVSGTTLVQSSTSSVGSMCELYSLQTEQCLTTIGHSFFQFGLTDVSDISEAGTLIITSCEFKNFFYDFTSFIGLNNGHGFVDISDTTFDKFSNCGSIIRDSRFTPSLDYDNEDLEDYNNILMSYRSSMYSYEINQNRHLITTSTACEDKDCSKIEISGSTFSNFNYLKDSGNTAVFVGQSNPMRQQGLIFNLDSFYGKVHFYDNTIDSLKFKYGACEEYYNDEVTFDGDEMWDDNRDVLQAKGLIYMNVLSGEVEIYGNSFSNSNSALGLIYLKRYYDESTLMLIHDNTFTGNSALIGGANAIKIDLYHNNLYRDEYTHTHMDCSGVKISSNTFTTNVG